MRAATSSLVPITIRPLRRVAAVAGVTGLVAFSALAVLFLLQWAELKPRFFDALDPFWLKAYAVATVAAGTMVWFFRGKLLMVTAVLAAAAILLTPAVCGATGWALPKLILITALAIGLGQRGMKWIAPSATLSCLDRLVLTALFGYAVLSLVVMGLGLLYLWRASIVAILFLILGMAVFRDFVEVCRHTIDRGLRPFLSRWPDADLRLPALVLSTLCISGFGCYLCSVAPNTHWDVLHYHLGIPTIYVERGGMVPLDHTLAVHYVRNAEMLYTLGLLVEGQPLPTLFNFLFGLLCTGMVIGLGTLVAGRRVGYIAGAIFFAVPLVSYVLSEGLIDATLVAYVSAAIYAFLKWQRNGRSHWILLFSFFAGIAAGTKLNGAAFLAPLAPIIVVQSLLWRQGWRDRLTDMMRLIGPAMLVLLPWLVLAWVRTGNPVFPVLNNIFHSPEWYQDSFMSGVDWQGFGLGKSWWYALRMPWDLTFHGERFGELGWFAMGGIFLLGAPFAYFALPPRQRRSVLVLMLVIVFSMAVFFKLAQYGRYMLPLVALCAVMAAMNCTAVWNALSRWPRFKLIPLGACLMLALGWLMFSRAVHVSTLGRYMPGRYPWQFALARQTVDECLRKSNLAQYDFLKFVKDQLPDKPVVFLGIGLGVGTYCGDAVEYSRWHTLKGKSMVEEQSAPRLLSMLKENHVGYLAVNESFVQDHEAWRRIINQSAAMNPEFQRRYCEPIFGRTGAVLHRLHLDAAGDSVGDQRPSLVDTSLEPASDGTMAGWVRTTEKVTAMPAGSHPDGPDIRVLRVTYQDCICQSCPVRENATYSLSADFWSPTPGQICMLHILWADETGNQTHNEVFVREVGASPTRFEMSRTSASGTRSANIFVRAKDGSTVLMSRPRLIERSAPSEAPDSRYERLAQQPRE